MGEKGRKIEKVAGKFESLMESIKVDPLSFYMETLHKGSDFVILDPPTKDCQARRMRENESEGLTHGYTMD